MNPNFPRHAKITPNNKPHRGGFNIFPFKNHPTIIFNGTTVRSAPQAPHKISRSPFQRAARPLAHSQNNSPTLTAQGELLGHCSRSHLSKRVQAQVRNKWGEFTQPLTRNNQKGRGRSGVAPSLSHPLYGKSQIMIPKLHLKEFPQQWSLQQPEMGWAECPSWADTCTSHQGHPIPPAPRSLSNDPKWQNAPKSPGTERAVMDGVFQWLPCHPLWQSHNLGTVLLFHFPCYYQKFHPSKNTSCHKAQRDRWKGF